MKRWRRSSGLGPNRWIAKHKARTGLLRTQGALAEKAGVHQVYIAQIEAQTKTPSLRTLETLAGVLKVKVAELLE
jgi:predicted transcriptional regulator